MERLERLEAAEAIRNVKARYFRYMDTKQFDALRDVFASDLKVITPEGAIYADSGAGYAASLAQSLEHCVSCHQGFSPEIEILDDGTASGIWPMQDVIEWETAHPRAGWKAILGRGHYHETYRIEDGTWRIATMMLTRLRLDITWPDCAPEGHEA